MLFFLTDLAAPAWSRTLSRSFAVGALCVISACQPVTDLQARLFGAGPGSGAESESATGGGSGTAPTPMPPMPAATQTLAWFADGADILARVNVAALRVAASPVATQLVGAMPSDEQIDQTIRQALLELDVPSSVAERLRPSQVQSMTIGLYGDSESVVVVTELGILINPPPDGSQETIDGVTFAVRGSALLVGVGQVFTDALVAPPVSPINPEAAWAGGWADGNDALIHLFVPDVAGMPDTMRDDLRFGDTTPSRISMTFSGTGAVRARLGLPSDTGIRQVLGAAQQAMTAGIADMRSELPPQAQSVASYFDLVLRAAWAQLILESADGDVIIGVRESTCGHTWMNSLALLTAVGVGMEEGATYPGATFQPQTQRIADNCRPMPGPAAAFPRSMARVVGFESGASPASGAILIDYAGFMRQILPTMAGVLPFALHPEDIAAALPAAQLGLSGYDAAGANVVAAYTDSPALPNFLVAVPESLRAVLPPEAMIFPGVSVPDVGYVVAMPDANAALARLWDASAPWAQTLDALPSNAALAAIVNQGAIRMATDEMRLSVTDGATELAAVLSRIEYLAFSTDLVAGSRLAMYFPANAAGEAAQLNSAIRTIVERTSADLPEDARMVMAPMVSQALNRFQATASGDHVVIIDLAPASTNGDITSAALTALIGLVPSFIEGFTEGLGSFDEASGGVFGTADELATAVADSAVVYYGSAQFSPDGKVEPSRFPRAFGPLPSPESITAACSIGATTASVPADLWSAGPAVWFQVEPPAGLRSLQFQSAGAGSDASFSVTVTEDTDCDGVFAQYVRIGSVVSGAPVYSISPAINPGE